MGGQFIKFFLLAIVTCGIYPIYWQFKTKTEMRDALVEIAGYMKNQDERAKMRDAYREMQQDAENSG